MTRLPFDVVLFDVDGTLIDSNGAHADAWAQALREEGVDVDATRVRPLIGMGADKLLPAIANIHEDSLEGRRVVRRKGALFGRALPFLAPTPGARALLEFLRAQGIDLAIATSADDRELAELLKRAGVEDLFPRRASKDDATESKPDPDIVRAALEKSGAARNRAVMVGDTPYDLEAAKRAGIDAVALRSGGYWADGDLAESVGIFDDPAALHAHWRSKGDGSGEDEESGEEGDGETTTSAASKRHG